MPQPEVVSSANLTFIMRLATSRCQWDSALKGLYVAMEIFGTRMVPQLVEGQELPAYWPIRPTLKSKDPRIPTPVDYNFLMRLLKIYPLRDETSKIEVRALTSIPASSRINVVSFYNAILGAATTTVLYGANITNQMINMWCTNDALIPRVFTDLMSQALNNPLPGLNAVEPVIFDKARQAFNVWVGASVAQNLFPEDTWVGNVGEVPHQVFATIGQIDVITPNLINPLVLVEWIKTLPFEWGYVNAKPQLNLAGDIRMIGQLAQTGCYARKGCSIYGERAAGDWPIDVVVYGPHVINALCQLMRMDVQPVVSSQSAPWTPYAMGSKDDVEWGAPAFYFYRQ